MNVYGSAGGTKRIVVVRAWCAEQCHHRVANMLVDRTAIIDDDPVDEVGVAAYQVAQLLRVKRLRQCAEPAEIDEQNRNLSPFA